jgi:CheY-like chemotaxis protein
VQGLWKPVTEKPDLIILDLAMPGGSGDEILDVLQENEQTAGTPVLVLSGNLHRSLSRQLEKHGAVRCFCKPLPFEELLAEIRRFVPAVA